MERLKKVICWRIVSILTTLAFSFAWLKEVSSATEFTFILHAFLMLNHWLFETYWESRKKNVEQMIEEQ